MNFLNSVNLELESRLLLVMKPKPQTEPNRNTASQKPVWNRFGILQFFGHPTFTCNQKVFFRSTNFFSRPFKCPPLFLKRGFLTLQISPPWRRKMLDTLRGIFTCVNKLENKLSLFTISSFEVVGSEKRSC